MVRTFDTKSIEPEKLHQIVENILSGPSAGYSQGIELLILEEEGERLKFFRQWGSDKERESYRQKWPNLENAPLIILVCVDESRYRDRYTQADKQEIPEEGYLPWWYIDGGMAVLLGLLTAVDQELVATFTGVHSQQYLQSTFNIPDRIEVIGALLIGYQGGKYRPSTSVSRGKRPTDEIVHYHSW